MRNEHRDFGGQKIKKTEELPADWQLRERKFHLEQAKMGAQMRLESNQAEPVDVLTALIYPEANKLSPKIDAMEYISSVENIDKLKTDAKMFTDIETEPNALKFWKLVCISIEKYKKEKLMPKQLQDFVYEDLVEIFSKKDYRELLNLEANIDKRLQSKSVDYEFWETALVHLGIRKRNLMMQEILRPIDELRSKLNVTEFSNISERMDRGPIEQVVEDKQVELPENEVPEIVQDRIDEVEIAFDGFLKMPKKEYSYETRMPKYTNTVIMGIEWNRYNQTHYSETNPPPKTVQGYKFNIFYPDLADVTDTPKYVKQVDEAGEDTMILRFSAGEPYEDICFRVVNRNWDYSHKHGFRCVLERGVLQLHFYLRKIKYKRA